MSQALRLGNLDGILIAASRNTVGGIVTGARNVISANGGEVNTGFGVFIFSGDTDPASGNLVQGNYIGTNATGTAALGNDNTGVFIVASNNTVGGTLAGSGNVVSANGEAGIVIFADQGELSTGNLVQGNFVGTNATGTAALGNFDGVQLLASGNTVGGTDPRPAT